MSRRYDIIEVDLLYIKTSTSGKGLSFWGREYRADEKPTWINLPVSQIEIDPPDPERRTVVRVSLPRWLAEENGCV